MLFDFRNVPLSERSAGYKNVTTLAHEGTHQLTFNSRTAQPSRATRRGRSSKGSRRYSETRPLHGHGEPGQINRNAAR